MSAQVTLSLDPETKSKLIAEFSINGNRRQVPLDFTQGLNSNSIISEAQEALVFASEISDNSEVKARCKQAAGLLANALRREQTLIEILSHVLKAQDLSSIALGEDGNPTEHQARHWQRHGILDANGKVPYGCFSDPSCPFCISEDRFELGKNRERSVKGLDLVSALTLGLKSRGYVQDPKHPGLWRLKNQKQNSPGAVVFLNAHRAKVFEGSRDGTMWSKSRHEALILDGKNEALRIHWEPSAKVRLKREGITVKTAGGKKPSTKALSKKLSLSW